MSSKSKVRFFFVLSLLSGCKSFSTTPLTGTSTLAPDPQAAMAQSASASEVRVIVVDSKEFNSLTPGFVLDPKIRDGLTLFSEKLVNEGKTEAHLTFQVKSDAVQIQTRIHEDAFYRYWLSNEHVSRVRFSTANFRLDQVKLIRISGATDFLSNQGTFELQPDEKVTLEWIAHSSDSTLGATGDVALCPFWVHQKYSHVGLVVQQTGTLDWAMIGSSIKSSIVRSLKVTGGQDIQNIIDDEDSATLNQVSGDGVPNVNDQQFTCDGLMQLLPSSP
jgi:hypothetical protein